LGIIASLKARSAAKAGTLENEPQDANSLRDLDTEERVKVRLHQESGEPHYVDDKRKGIRRPESANKVIKATKPEQATKGHGQEESECIVSAE
jgi:hypothetical protein